MSRLRANQITNENANGAPDFPHGLTVTGIVTTSSINTTPNIIVVGSAVTANSQGIDATGIITATSFKGDGSSLTGIDATQIATGNTKVQTVASRVDTKVDNVGVLTVTAAGANVTGIVTANSFSGGGLGGIVGFKTVRNTNTSTVNSSSHTTVFSLTYTPQDGANNKIYLLASGTYGQDDHNSAISYFRISCSGQHTTHIPGAEDVPCGYDDSGQAWHSYSVFLRDPNVTGNATMTYNFQVRTDNSNSDWRPQTSMSLTAIEVASGVDQTS